MMTPEVQGGKDNLYRYGLGFAFISLLTYALPLMITRGERSSGGDEYFLLFLANYGLSVSFSVMMLYSKQWQQIPVFLVLAFISAWSLNSTVPVFEHPVLWFSVLQLLCVAPYMLLPVFHRLPVWGRQVMGVVLGMALFLFLYLSVYLIPAYGVSFVLGIALGISWHAFIPLLLLVYTVYIIIKLSKDYSYILPGACAGFLLLLLPVVGFLYQWNKVDSTVKYALLKEQVTAEKDLPDWVYVAQQVPDDAVAEMYVKGDLVYTQFATGGDLMNWEVSGRRLNMARIHHPLIVVASMFCHESSLTEDDRIKILEAMYLTGHETQERYWTGKNLKTRTIATNVRIWPAQRMAYTEKTITVGNTRQKSRWEREEAIYTFHLPEGGIVTSLSLWIDGKEQPGILTTRGKADSAYRQIVGVESRDPSVVRWQEGNTVSVRVFPVPAAGNRIFKIGVSAPLDYRNGMLTYNNIWFEGPDNSSATELQQINWAGVETDPEMKGYNRTAAHTYERTGNYEEHWSLSVKDPGFVTQTFSYSGNNYKLDKYEQMRQQAVFNTVYLDLNASWTADETEQLIKLLKGKDVYVYDRGMMAVSEADEVVNRLRRRRFSLFPWHMVKDPSSSLVITKGGRYAPALQELRGFPFADNLAAGMRMQQQRVKVYDMGAEESLYQRTLREHRVFDYERGTLEQLKQLLAEGMFAISGENDSMVVVTTAGLSIVRSSDTARVRKGNDHIMRMYAYNHIMQQLRGNLYPEHYSDSTLVSEAEKAYVVTPVSSLVVLETQKDYDRFGIKRTEDALGNATMKGDGSVPEPHEWALIALALAVVIWTWRSKYRLKT